MRIKITGTNEFAVLAETEQEQQWLKCLTDTWGRKKADVAYTYPNYEPKDLNNPCVTISMGRLENE